jgi:polar amino acid transport system permease protein
MAADPTLANLGHLLQWSPSLLRGFGLNILISILAMALGTLAGLLVCAVRLAPLRPLARAGDAYVQIFRNAPKLALVYFASFVIPFEVVIHGHYFSVPDWLKVTLGLALPTSAYAAEIFRGAIQSIASGQWQAGASLGLRRGQILRQVILPQCVKRTLPPMMSLFCLISMSSALASLAGAQDLMSVAQIAAASVHSIQFTVIVYFATMALFFVYCYPLSMYTRRLERRLAHPG